MSNFVDYEIENKIIIIYGKMGTGKTMFGVMSCIIDFPDRIYSNVGIFQNGKQISKEIKTQGDIENIRFSHTQGVIIIDEGGLNMNSRQSMSDINRFLSEVIFLSRKKNCRMMFLAQNFENLDSNVKRLANLIVEMKKIHTPLMKFKIKVKKMIKNNLKTYREIIVDTLLALKMKNTKYDTLESSKIEFDKKKTIKLDKKRDLTIET